MLSAVRFIFIACIFSLPVSAQKIIIPIGTQKADVDVIKPSRGTTQAEVEKVYGAPLSIDGPKGEPPITKWEYDAISIYFENDSVIHSVINYKLNLEKEK